MKIAFFGTASFSASILHGLIQDDSIEVIFVVSQEDKPVGRKKILEETAVKKLAKKHKIKVLQPLKLKEDTSIREASKDIDFFVVVAYGKIIPQNILDIPQHASINLHGSILPRYRGASPVQESIKNGDRTTGLTTMYMSAGMDEGDILETEEVAINQNDTQVDIFRKFEDIGAGLLVSTLKKILEKSIVGKKQDDALVTYCHKISKSDGLIYFEKETASDIYNKYRAYTPWPGIYTYFHGKKLAIEECYLDDNGSTGDIGEGVKFGKEIGIVCQDRRILSIKKIKLEGKGTMNILDFVNGNPDFIGYTFLDV